MVRVPAAAGGRDPLRGHRQSGEPLCKMRR
jgi:hypothetical protein